MPRPKKPSGYPTVYSHLIETVASTGNEIAHRCENKKAAELLRFSLYDFIKACNRSNSMVERQLGEQAAGLMFCVRDNLLIIKSRDTTDESLSLQETLNKHLAKNQLPPIIQEPETRKQSPVNKPIAPPAGPSQDDLVDSFLKDKK